MIAGLHPLSAATARVVEGLTDSVFEALFRCLRMCFFRRRSTLAADEGSYIGQASIATRRAIPVLSRCGHFRAR
jgi:hypothetical protein